MEASPWHLSGIVYGVLLNQRSALAALGESASQPPYQAPPRAPVLYVKPRNTLNGPGGNVPVPVDAPQLEIGATLGIVFGRAACNVRAQDALDYIAGYTIVNDVSVPHSSFYRPSVKMKARDGSCCIGPVVVARERIADPDALDIRVYVDDQLAQRSDTRALVRPVRQLIADITEFMTLSAGDLLLVGVSAGAPQVRAGQRVAIEIDGIGRLENAFVAQTHNQAGEGA